MKGKGIVSLSGGMDSTTVLAQAVANGLLDFQGVGFTYGSKHNKYENEAAQRVAAKYEIPFRVIDLTGVMSGFRSNLLISGAEIPEGHYEAESMKLTVVPGRNLIFMAIVAGIAESEGAEAVLLGVHQGDHAIYPDCRSEFIESARQTISLSTDGRVRIEAPFLHTDKGGILEWGLQHDVPYELTRTCYKEQELACGKCGACQERLEAFRVRGCQDPIRYASVI